jgi:hypothetical protein
VTVLTPPKFELDMFDRERLSPFSRRALQAFSAAGIDRGGVWRHADGSDEDCVLTLPSPGDPARELSVMTSTLTDDVVVSFAFGHAHYGEWTQFPLSDAITLVRDIQAGKVVAVELRGTSGTLCHIDSLFALRREEEVTEVLTWSGAGSAKDAPA